MLQVSQGQPLHLGVFRSVGCFSVSSSYSSDALPAPAVYLLGHLHKKRNPNKIQITSWTVKAFAPCLWLPRETMRIRIKSNSRKPFLTIYHQKTADVSSIQSQLAIHITDTLWVPLLPASILVLKEGNSPMCRLARSLHCQQYGQPQRHPKTLHIANAEADASPECSDALFGDPGSAHRSHWHLHHASWI